MYSVKCESCHKSLPVNEPWHITEDGYWLCDTCFEELKIEAIVERLGIFKRLDTLEKKVGIK